MDGRGRQRLGWELDTSGEWPIADRIRITFPRLLLKLVGELDRRGVVEVEERARLRHGRDPLVCCRGRGTRVVSLDVFVDQRHVNGGGHRRFRLQLQILLQPHRQQADRTRVGLGWRRNCEGRRNLLLVVVVLFLLDARPERLPQRRADRVVDGNLVRR